MRLFLAFCSLAILATITTSTPNDQCQFSLDHAQKVSGPIDNFSHKLYTKIVSKNPDKNIIFSPLSISLALALVQAGSSGVTRTQLRNLLAPTNYSEDVSILYQSLQNQLHIQEEKVRLHLANGLWYNTTTTVKPQYLDKIKDCFEAAIEKVDFKADIEGVRRQINAFVSNATAEKIPQLIAQGSLDPESTVAVLVNAIYMKAAWKKEFNVEDGNFFPLGKPDPKSIKFITQTSEFTWSADQYFEMIGIPYAIDSLIMYIFKTHGKALDSDALESKMNPDIMRSLISKANRQTLKLKLPSFTIRLPTDLTQILKDLGLDRMFDGADFSRMFNAGKIDVSKVLHEAFIKVNENGTEAAAATGVIFENRSAIITPEFIADRPFMFIILHKPTNAILFTGKVNDPKEDE